MEEKLASYRLRKRRSEQVQSIKEKFFKMLTSQSKEINSSETAVKIEVSSYSLNDEK